MTRYHATSNGNVPFTAEEETARDAEEAAVIYLTEDELLAVAARDKRNDLLAATDWTANSDVTMTTEMTAYRTLLRNLPAQSGFPTTINWPTAP
mgnify:FL=1|tara:strand:+ start:501 stop:782 length:282 start_codon:yes stop_codon:yes gene_type:complete